MSCMGVTQQAESIQRKSARADSDALLSTGRSYLTVIDEATHRKYCAVCKLSHPEQVDRAYIAWATVDELAELHQVTPEAIKLHAAYYSLALFRAANIRAGYAEYIAAGLEKRDDITPELGLRALVKLDELTSPTPTQPSDPAGQVNPAEPGCWERVVRLTVRERAGADTRPTVGAGSDGKDHNELTYHGKAITLDPEQPARAAWPEP